MLYIDELWHHITFSFQLGCTGSRCLLWPCARVLTASRPTRASARRDICGSQLYALARTLRLALKKQKYCFQIKTLITYRFVNLCFINKCFVSNIVTCDKFVAKSVVMLQGHFRCPEGMKWREGVSERQVHFQ